ncbi:DNA mismatch repair protein MutS [Thermoflexales bacterium]|nr:DNA mismatch repair protein MutS [Thermoflexales bacterium]
MTNDDLTPIRRQYLQLKSQYPDSILFFRLGDFYETFDGDAELIACELDLVLTSRPVGKGQRVPLAGVPYHAADNYIARLIEKGYRVAVAEQLADPSTVKGIVPRDVTRVVTPGTVIEPELLDEKRPNYLAAWLSDGQHVGFAYADVTTGEFAATQIEAIGAGEQELLRVVPRECLVPAHDEKSHEPVIRPAVNSAPIRFTPFAAWHFESSQARQGLLDHFQVTSLAGFGLDRKPLAVRAAGAVVHYLKETQAGTLAQFTSLHAYSTSEFMALDPATRRNLELTDTLRGQDNQFSLLGVLDHTRTAMGSRLLRAWLSQPLLDRSALDERLDRVQRFCHEALLRAKVRELLKTIPDLERAVGRVISGHAVPRDLIAIRATLQIVPNLVKVLEAAPGWSLDPAPAVLELLQQALVEQPPSSPPGIIQPGFSAELDGVLGASRNAKEWVANLERSEKERTSIKSLKVGYNKVFGYYIEVTHANTQAVPENYIRKQTLTNAERYITPELKEYETLILNADERLIEIEQRLFKELCAQVAARSNVLLSTARTIAQIDVAAALAEAAALNRYVRPELTDENALHIVGGRHPVVEQALSETRFVPNDVTFDEEARILIITGPNMSGKSTYLRQVALIVLMAQIGSFVPADRAQIGLVDRIFTRIGAQDDIATGQSTFMVEMVETANILHHATARSLIVLDEIGRGTSTYDGLSIAWAVVEYIHNHPRLRAKTLFATHYHELIQLAEHLPHVRNYNVAVAEEGDKVVFLHHIVPGGADRSYGIHVAQLAGLPKPVIRRAEELLEELEQGQRDHAERTAAAPEDGPLQLSLFGGKNPVLDELEKLDVNALSPLEALNKLFEWKKKAG